MISWAQIWPIFLTQLLALLVAATAVSSEKLAESYGISCPTLQSVGNYVLLLVVYLPYYLKVGDISLERLQKDTWWRYALLALVDFEANYLIVKEWLQLSNPQLGHTS